MGVSRALVLRGASCVMGWDEPSVWILASPEGRIPGPAMVVYCRDTKLVDWEGVVGGWRVSARSQA